MNSFTYETKQNQSIFETYEWDNCWIEQANDAKQKRLFYIGDSISCATRRIVTEQAKHTVLTDGFGTSKSIDNPYFADGIKQFARQLPKVDVILFNNGLHGWHLEDAEEYGYHYEKMVQFLKREYPDAKLMLALTTPTKDPEREKRVPVRNEQVLAIAKKYDLPVVDLYAPVRQKESYISSDKVHLTPEGYEMLAKIILENM